MVWQPASQEPSALSELLAEAVRTVLFPGDAVGTPIVTVPGEVWRESVLPDGRPVRIELTVSPAETMRYGVRACAGMRVTGRLVAGREGFRVEADVVVDRMTRALLANDVRVIPLGPVGN